MGKYPILVSSNPLLLVRVAGDTVDTMPTNQDNKYYFYDKLTADTIKVNPEEKIEDWKTDWVILNQEKNSVQRFSKKRFVRL